MPMRSPLHHRSRTLLACVALARISFAHADCIDDAAARHQVNATVLRAIGWHESRLQPQALGRNANGSIDIGAFQINSVHLSELGRYGIQRADLSDGCTSADVAAWHYRRQIDRFGNGWQAVGAWHSLTPGRTHWYANRIAAILMRWNVLPAAPLPFPAAGTPAPDRPARTVSRGGGRVATAAARPSVRPTGLTASAFREVAYVPPIR
jgi:hypothetical protein